MRVLWRQTLLWSLVLAALGLLLLVASVGQLRAIVVLLIYAVASLFTSERGLHDRIAGTWLVPR